MDHFDFISAFKNKLNEHKIAPRDFIPYNKRVIGMGGMLDSSRFKYFIYK